MKKFWKDYWELWKSSGRFVKKHWIGCIIMNLITTLITILYYYPQLLEWIWEKISGAVSAVFHKK